MKISIKGDIIPNDDKYVYDWLEQDATCPRDVAAALDKAAGEPVDVTISSGGGDIFAGGEIYGALRSYPGEVHIHVVYAASAASVIACARESDIIPTGLMMVHNVSSAARGDYHDMDKSSEILQKANRAIAAAYMEKTGKPEAEILALMDRETWLTGREAVELGLVDGVSAGSGPAAGFMRLTAGGPGTLPPQVIDKLKNSIGPPAQREPSRRRAEAALLLLRLKGECK